jgi:hypothetical protein
VIDFQKLKRLNEFFAVKTSALVSPHHSDAFFASAVTLKPATCGQFKTGHFEGPET